jgi:AcrR family transcriptional regulator
VTARKKPVAAEKTTVARRPRRTREEGKALLLAAATKLLESQGPDDVTIREIRAEAGVHHRFVMEWFGGKAALLREVHASRANTLASRIAITKDFHGAEKSAQILSSILVADAMLRPHMGFKYPLFDVLAHFVQAVRK